MFKDSNGGISLLFVIGAIAVLAIIIVGGFLGYQYLSSYKNNNQQIPSNQPRSGRSSVAPAPASPPKSGLTGEQISQRKLKCQNIKDYFKKNACYGNLAIDANDSTLCPEFGSAVCKYFVFMWHTNICGDVSISKPIFGFGDDQATLKSLKEKQECIKKIAINTKNVELCKNLFDQAADCQNEVALKLNDPSKCSDYPGDCVMKIAVHKKDITVCESKYPKAWCIVQFPRLLQGFLNRKPYNQSCYMPPAGVETAGYYETKNNYMFPNTYDAGTNDYPPQISPKSAFKHLLSIPFNNSSDLLRVYSNNGNYLALLRLVKYSVSSGTSEILGDISSETGSNWGGIYIPIAISKDDNHIIFKAHMGLPGAGGGSATLGYAYSSLSLPKYDVCGYIDPQKIANQVYFYDNFAKAIFLTEEGNVPASAKPGPDYNSAIKFINIVSGETETLLKKPKTIYEIINIDERSKKLKFKSCPWKEDRFTCPASDTFTQVRFINLR